MESEFMTLGITLTEVISRNTISFIGGKMALAKEKKTLEEQSLAYTEIINNLLQDKEDLTIIARQYKQAYDHVTISDEDIQYLHNTLKSAITLISMFSQPKEGTEASLNTLVELLNKDTLKTMQLLGFNYKEAIGRPLTEACSSAIKTRLKIKK